MYLFYSVGEGVLKSAVHYVVLKSHVHDLLSWQTYNHLHFIGLFSVTLSGRFGHVSLVGLLDA